MSRLDVQRHRLSLIGNCWHVSVTMFWLQCLVMPRLVIEATPIQNVDKTNPLASVNTGNPISVSEEASISCEARVAFGTRGIPNNFDPYDDKTNPPASDNTGNPISVSEEASISSDARVALGTRGIPNNFDPYWQFLP
eukprot:12408432-Karenia_brevis.AAC.1